MILKSYENPIFYLNDVYEVEINHNEDGTLSLIAVSSDGYVKEFPIINKEIATDTLSCIANIFDKEQNSFEDEGIILEHKVSLRSDGSVASVETSVLGRLFY